MKHFSMNEFQCRCGKCRMPDEVMANLEALVENVLDPVRERLGKPIIVNSGFRCPIHNKTVGGATGSQHMKGEAADLRIDGKPEALAKVIVELGKFDQVIVYPTFIHVSWKRGGGNRQQILRKTAGGYLKVTPSEL